MLILSMNVDKKNVRIRFLIVICHLTGDKKHIKTLFLGIFDLHSTIVKSLFDCHLSGVSTYPEL